VTALLPDTASYLQGGSLSPNVDYLYIQTPYWFSEKRHHYAAPRRPWPFQRPSERLGDVAIGGVGERAIRPVL